MHFRLLFTAALLVFPGLLFAQTDCTSFSFNPASTNASAGGGSYSTTITSTPASGCNRPAPVSDSTWIIPSTGGGTGGGILGFAVSATNSGKPRSGTIAIGPSVYTVNQAAGNCTYSLSGSSQTISGAGGNNSFTVTPSFGDCSWNAGSNASWITITNSTSQSGPGAVAYTVDPNPNTYARTGTISAAGLTFTITQTGACQFTLTPTRVDLPYTGGLGTVAISASVSSCAWTATTQASSWAQISFGGNGGTGNGTVGYSVSQNNSGNPRSTTLTIGGAIFTIAQDGAPCTISVNPQSLSFPANGGPEQAVSVTTASGCSWQASTPNSDWITINSGASGTGNGNVNISAAANTTGADRTGSVTIGSTTVLITQAGCQITVSPTSLQNLPPTAITGGIVSVSAATGCSWTSASSITWLQVKSGASGSGNGNVTYAVDANSTGQVRSGTLTVGGTAIPVSQNASACQITTTPSSFKFGVSGGDGVIKIATSLTTCAWTATSNSTWIQISGAGTGSGAGSFTFSVQPNTSSSVRTGAIFVNGNAVNITQDPQPPQTCAISLSASSFNAPAAGGTGSFDIGAVDTCAWSVTTGASWITLTSSASGTGASTVTFSVAANTTSQTRLGTIAVNGAAFFQVSQPGVACSLAISPKSAGFPADGGPGSVSVTSPCDWTAASKADWIVLGTPAGGSGNATLSYSIKPNTATQGRASSIAFSVTGVPDVTLPVTQSSASCSYTLTPASATMPGAGGTGSFKVSSSAGCDWTAASDSPWLKVVSFASVSGSGTVQYSVDFSAIGAQRTGTISVAGQTFTLTQDVGGPVIAAGGIMNAASYVTGPVAPGEIVSIFGQGLGPADPAFLQLSGDGKSITTAIGGARVLFDGVAAPVTYASGPQVNCIVPYGVDGKSSTVVKVEYQGVPSQPVTMNVGATSPAVFGSDLTGGGQGAILNQDYKVNGAANPAARGSVVMIFATGEGQTKPTGVDGKLAVAPLAAPMATVTAQIGGLDAKVNYAGAAPTLVSGVLQVNVVVPANVPPGNTVPVVIKVGGAPTQQGITMAVK